MAFSSFLKLAVLSLVMAQFGVAQTYTTCNPLTGMPFLDLEMLQTTTLTVFVRRQLP